MIVREDPERLNTYRLGAMDTPTIPIQGGHPYVGFNIGLAGYNNPANKEIYLRRLILP